MFFNIPKFQQLRISAKKLFNIVKENVRGYRTYNSQLIEYIKIFFFQKERFNNFVFNIPKFQQLRISVKDYLIF